MTIPSFQPIQQQQVSAQINPLVLKQGQVFHGKIKQLYPNQMAEIQIGEHRLIAKLETPLKAGDSHYFQVMSTSPQTELKVVTGPMTKEFVNVQQLIETLHLPKSPEMQQLLTHFIKHQLPIVKEQILQSDIWLKNLPDGVTKQEALQTLQKMMELKIPFSEVTFKALLLGSKTSGISNNLEQLTQLLQQNHLISPQIKENLLNALQSIAKPFEAETAGMMIARSVQILLQSDGQETKQLEALNILKEANILPKDATLNNWLNTATLSSRNETAGFFVRQLQSSSTVSIAQTIQQITHWIKGEVTLTEQQKNTIHELLKSFENTNHVEQLAKQLHVQLLKAFSEQTVNRLFLNEDGVSPKEHLLSLLKQEMTIKSDMEFIQMAKAFQASKEPSTQVMMAESQAILESSLNSQGIQKAIQQILIRLGLSYEAALNKGEDVTNLIQSIKPQLLSLIQDEKASTELKNSAEMVLARLNGMQLLSGETGHQHQIIMQLPLQFLGKHVDATIQWNGRMKKDGKIDSNYARILFYLNLEALKETVIDMQVQNRIVSIYVYNELEGLDVLAEPLKKALKVGLEEKNYHLSGVLIKPYKKTLQKNLEKNIEKLNDRGAVQRGVDIRV
ncbi:MULTISPECIES: hypothetical protein [Ureibacillus]|uniref:hypothetical protein n=1 Tax=Ureibacillus TaxID=160795 RepID=UPI000BBB8727|nr:hypothetical protein [Ureibacillus thermosphaericus]